MTVIMQYKYSEIPLHFRSTKRRSKLFVTGAVAFRNLTKSTDVLLLLLCCFCFSKGDAMKDGWALQSPSLAAFQPFCL